MGRTARERQHVREELREELVEPRGLLEQRLVEPRAHLMVDAERLIDGIKSGRRFVVASQAIEQEQVVSPLAPVAKRLSESWMHVATLA